MPDTEPTPKVVYHYTSIDTMMKIVQTRQIWATSIEYLNDTRERELFLTNAIQIVKRLSTHPEFNPEVFADYLEPSVWTSHDITELPSVASFSRFSDSLPQWRSYCPNGNGVSIGFKVAALVNATINGDFSLTSQGTRYDLSFPVHFREVHYVQDGDYPTIEQIVRSLYASAITAPSQAGVDGSTVDPPVSQIFRLMLEDIAATYKDGSFKSEAEFRLLAGGVYWKQDNLRYRTTRSSLVPYLRLDIPSTMGALSPTTSWDAIHEVKIGPNANVELTTRAVIGFFRSNGLNVTVSPTKVPYRDW